MRLAVASGKGGTGKTTVAVSLALSAKESVDLLDCDVEEPNAHIFLGADLQESRVVSVPVPQVDDSKCALCGQCSDLCQFNAIVTLPTRTLVFPELCHSCGGCILLCPSKALSEVQREIGTISTGSRNRVTLVQGTLDIGQAMSPPLIREVLKSVREDRLTIVDCPPGTSCPVIAAVKGSDYAILVTEPTPFGLHDLKLAVETLRQLKIPFGIVINRLTEEDDLVQRYCREEQLEILGKIPEDRRVAEGYSRGIPLVEAVPEMQSIFQDILSAVTLASVGGRP